MTFDSVGDDINKFLRNVLIAGGLALAGIVVAAFDLGHHHAQRKKR